MKFSLSNSFVLMLLLAALNSCQKSYLPLTINGYFVSQNSGSPLGNSIELFTDNTTETTFGNTHYHGTYSHDGSIIYFSNGDQALLNGSNSIVFEESVEYLNTDYYDGNGDGFDDWDANVPHYIWQDFQFFYYKQ